MHRKYLTGVTLRLHETKRKYQPNMLISMLITCIVIITVGLMVPFFQCDSSVDSPLVLDRIDVQSQPATLSSSGRSRLDTRPAKYQHHEGFAGFNGYMLGGYSVASAEYEPSGNDMEPDELPFVYDYSDTSSGLIGCGDSEYGLPKSKTFLDIMPLGTPHVDFAVQTISSKVPVFDAPPVIELANVRYPEKGWHVNGVVMVVFVISEKGGIEGYEVLREEPEGLDFARALKDAFNESVFFPGKVNGENVAVRLNFTYEFCWTCPMSREIQISRGVIIASSTY